MNDIKTSPLKKQKNERLKPNKEQIDSNVYIILNYMFVSGLF